MLGVSFGDRHSKEYEAIMNYARVTPPAIKENYIDIPGGDSSLDLTEAVGGITYGDGTIEFLFTLFDFKKAEKMKNDLHGRRFQIILDREPDFYFMGRLTCTRQESVGNLWELAFSARVEPYKYEKLETLHTEQITGIPKVIQLLNGRKAVMPVMTVKGEINLTYEGTRFTMSSGVYQTAEIMLYEGLNRITLSGEGNIQFRYRKGMLI